MAKYKYEKRESKILLTGKDAARMLKHATDILGLDMRDYDLKRTRKYLSKGTPLSELIIEMRERP